MMNPINIVAITPSMSGGSWVSIKEFIEVSNDDNLNYYIVGLGSTKYYHDKVKVFSLPFFRYDGKIGILMSFNPLLSFLYELPLYLMSLLVILKYKPKLIIGNGLLISTLLILPSKLVKSRLVISYHGYLGEDYSFFLIRILKSMLNHVDNIMVNSEGSKNDVSKIFNEDKIIIISHWANSIFFSDCNRGKLREKYSVANEFVLSFVGRISVEKNIDLLCDVISKINKTSYSKLFKFFFVGVGEYLNEIKDLEKKYKNVRYLGYIQNRFKLKEIYCISDLLYSYADTTYLARPAVEALACGTPVLIPNRPAVLKNKFKKIPDNLIPSSIGGVVEAKPDSILKFVLNFMNTLDENALRQECRSYALKHHHPQNLKNIKINILKHFTDLNLN